MPDAYEAGRGALERLAEWYSERQGDRNEATTRFAMIDRLLFECLAWSKDSAALEEPHGREYADYVLSVFRPVLIVEAKREGDYFELPAGSKRLEQSLPSLVRDYPNLRAALEQAAHYCQSRGVPFGAVTNGHQVIAFIANRNDGTPPLDGKALVFDSLDAMLAHFLDLWQALSPAGMEAKKLQYRLAGGMPDVPPKLSATLPDYPGVKKRNVVQGDLQVLSDIVIEDVIRSPELEPEFLRQCYCQSGALSQFALASKGILETRYAGLFESSKDAPVLASAVTKAGVSTDLLGASIARRPILLLGDVGVGKTTFIRHLINVDAADVFKKAICLHLDLGLRGTLATDLRLHVVDEMVRQLLEKYSVDVSERNFVRGVYHGELKRFGAGIYADLRVSSPEDFLRKELEYLEALVHSRETHLRKSLEHISSARRKQIVLFLDNADQRDEKTQELAFLIGQELAGSWPAIVFVALRPETFHRSKKIGALTGYHAKAFTIAPPRTDLVLRKRLNFALKLTTGEIPIPSFDRVGVNLEKLSTIIKVVRESIDGEEELIEFIDNISAGNIRLALDLVRSFIGSGHVDTQKILDIVAERGSYTVPLHEFLRATIYGDNEYYDPAISRIANIFDVSSLDRKEHFIVPLLLGVLHRASSLEARDGFWETGKVYEALQGMEFVPDQIDRAVSRACEKSLVETNERLLPEPGQERPSALRITSKGEYHLQRLAGQFQYLDAVVVDTPILDQVMRESIGNAPTIEKRLDRVEGFVKYLSSCWSSVNLHAVGFNWFVHSDTAGRQVTNIRRAVSRSG